MCSRWCRGRRAVGREHSPEELQCWSYGCWMRIFPASLAAACLSGSWWSTDKWRWDGELYQFILKGVRDDGVKSRAEVYKQDQILWNYVRILSSHKSLVCPDAAGWSAVPCWLHHPQTYLLCRQTAGGPIRVQWRPSDKPKPVFQMISWPQTLEPQVCSH